MPELQQNYESYLFDWDGCLAKTLPIWIEAHQEGIADFGGNAEPRDIAKVLGAKDIARDFGVHDYEACYDHITKLGHERLQDAPLYPGTREVLETFSSAGKLAILSNCPRDTLVRGITNHGLAEYFDVVLSRSDVTHGKPHPEIIQTALTILDAPADKAVMIGDSIHDIQAAKNAGVDSVTIYHPGHNDHYDIADLRAEKPTYIVNGLFQLREVLLGKSACSLN